MRGSVWILIMCYLTNRNGAVFGKEKIYGFSDVRQINTIQQQKLQYNKALNKALATYRTNHDLDSDTEVNFTHLNDGITYEGSKNGIKKIKRKRTKLSGSDKRQVRYEVLRKQAEKGETGKTIQKKDMEKMYNKKVTQKEFKENTMKKTKENKYKNIQKEIKDLTPQEKKRLIKELQK
jgi:hypothetical protein